AGVRATVLAIDVVIPHFRHGAASSFSGRYAAVGGSAGGIVRKAFTDPGKLLSVAFDHRGAHYLLDLLLPIIVLAVLAPLMLVALLPEIALNLLSSVDAQKSIHFHYVAGEVPILFAAAAIGLGRVGRWAGTASLSSKSARAERAGGADRRRSQPPATARADRPLRPRAAAPRPRTTGRGRARLRAGNRPPARAALGRARPDGQARGRRPRRPQ